MRRSRSEERSGSTHSSIETNPNFGERGLRERDREREIDFLSFLRERDISSCDHDTVAADKRRVGRFEIRTVLI